MRSFFVIAFEIRGFFSVLVFRCFRLKVLNGACPIGGRCLQEQFVLVVHAPATTEELTHFDASFRISPMARAGWDIQNDPARRTA